MAPELIIIVIVTVVILSIMLGKKNSSERLRRQDKLAKSFANWDLSVTDIMSTNSKYVGGHPDGDNEGLNIVVGAKNGQLIFFGGGSGLLNCEVKNGKLFFYEGLYATDLYSDLSSNFQITIKSMDILFNSMNPFRYLFSIPIRDIRDIQYIDATTRSTKAIIGTSIGGIGIGAPIKTKDENASVFIDWVDGNFCHSIELKITQQNANTKANTLRNALIRMIKNSASANLQFENR